MKKLIAKLLVGAFSLVLCVNLSAEEWKTYKFTDPDKSRSQPHPDVITLNKGDIAEFVNMISSHKYTSYLQLDVYLDEDIKISMNYYASASLTNDDARH